MLISTSFLINCANWFRRDAGLVFIWATLESGFDPTVIDSPNCSEWPKVYPGVLLHVGCEFDLFFLTLVCKDNQGFAGMTPLHEAVLFGQPEDVQLWATRSKKNERNFLGQTPLHLAFCKPQHLRALLDAGHGPDVVDTYGFTPLMYAAASSKVDAARILLRASTYPVIQQGILDFTFANIAISHLNWEFVMDLFFFFDDEVIQTMAEVLARQTLPCLFQIYWLPVYCGHDYLLPMLSKCKSLNVPLEALPEVGPYTKGRTLLHYAHTATEVDALLGHDSNIINQVDQKGQHALMSVILDTNGFDLDSLATRLLDFGANINLQDKRGHTTCHIITQQLSSHQLWSCGRRLDCLHTLVTRSADVLIPDNCRCSCSVSGCLPTVVDGIKGPCDVRTPTEMSAVPLTEWVILIFETLGIETAKQTLLATIRQAEHKKLDMTHTCCRRTPYYDRNPDTMPEDDIDDIIEEESDFIRILDEKMGHESKRSFNSLLRSAILGTKPPMDQDGQRLWSTETFEKDPVVHSYDVDRDNDRFVPRYKPDPTFPPRTIRAIMIDIVEYIRWLEKYFFKRKTSDQIAQSSKRDCYLRRLSWLYYMCHVMEVPTEDLAEIFHYRATNPHGPPYEKGYIDEDFQHFWQSWEEWIAKGPGMGVDSTDGFADWPLREMSG
ncbi:hypothetical protein NCS56_00333500 [Fusarium sp. Ph1]|nr:hypothetical protein NCS56_00333500 [Fusarium sp. Ph1]